MLMLQTIMLAYDMSFLLEKSYLPPGPGFVSMSPAITSSKGITTTIAVSCRIPATSTVTLT